MEVEANPYPVVGRRRQGSAVQEHPAVGFAAARTPDWQGGAFTPSLRLVFSLLAVMTAIRFLWAGQESVLYDVVEISLDTTISFETGAARHAYISTFLDWYVFFFPICFMALHVFVAWPLRIWGKGTGYAVRLRLQFLGLVPSTLLSLIASPAFSTFHADAWAFVGPLFILAMFVLDGVTVFRGGVADRTVGARFWRALLFGSVGFIVGMVTNIAAMTLASAWQTYGPEIQASLAGLGGV